MLNKSSFIWFNGMIMPWVDAKIHVMSHALHYGSSVFEGIRSYDSYKGPVIFRHKDHMRRLINSSKIYRIPIAFDIEELMQANKNILDVNQLTSAYIRPIVFINNTDMDICPSSNYKTDFVIAAFLWGSYLGKNSIHEGINVIVSSWNRVSPNTIPFAAKISGNYLSSMLIGHEARRLGYDEGIALDVCGYVAEGSGENLFEVRDDILFTPPLISSILPGITRDTIIKLAMSIGLVVKEEILSRESLYLSDEIFLSGTAAEIVPVRSVDDIIIGSGKCGVITRKLQNLFFGLFTGDTEDQWGWLDALYK